METITINFGLVASLKFPSEYSSRVLAPINLDTVSDADVRAVANDILLSLREIGCVIEDIVIYHPTAEQLEPTLAVRVQYPVDAEIADCAPPSVMRYEKYMRLYEVACYYAQDAVAVLEHRTGKGVLVGANTKAWGEFDINKFKGLRGV